jgi:hypothetical protein
MSKKTMDTFRQADSKLAGKSELELIVSVLRPRYFGILDVFDKRVRSGGKKGPEQTSDEIEAGEVGEMEADLMETTPTERAGEMELYEQEDEMEDEIKERELIKDFGDEDCYEEDDYDTEI